MDDCEAIAEDVFRNTVLKMLFYDVAKPCIKAEETRLALRAQLINHSKTMKIANAKAKHSVIE